MRWYGVSTRWIVVACIAIVAVVWGVTYQRIGFERDEDTSNAIRVNDNLALALEEQSIRTIKVIDQVLRLLEFEYLEEGSRMPSALFSKIYDLDPAIYRFVSVIDAQGTMRFGTLYRGPIDFSDREYFIHHRDHPEDGLRISGPIVGRISGSKVLILSRRIERKDGSFGGVVAAGVDPDYFSRLYDKVNLSPKSLVQLVALDGLVLARRAGGMAGEKPDMRSATLLKEASRRQAGSFLSQGRVDGVRRHMSFRVLPEYGLIVAVGQAVAEVNAPSANHARWYLLGSSLATLFVVIFGAGIVTALRRREQALEAARAGEALYRTTFEEAGVGITHNALDGRFLRANPKYCELTGYDESELLRMTFKEVLHPDDAPGRNEMERLLEHGAHEIENRHIRKDGEMRWCSVSVALVRKPGGAPDYFVAMVQDITERKQAEAQLTRNAHYDALTGLPNRTLLFDRLAQMLKHARRESGTVGLLFVDLDRFKNVNDTLGHENGDLLLRAAAERLAAGVRTEDTVARIGGDEFVIVLPELADAQDAARIAKKLTEAMAAPFRVAGREIFVTASIGIAVFPGDGPEGEVLLNNANAAMQRAKQVGRNNFQFYTASLNARSAEKLLLEADLRRALERREFVLHYQPKVSARDGRVEGFEALIRWKKADGGLVPPGSFIPLLEESGLIVDVGAWVIRAACAQLREWQRAGLAAAPIAVNVSANQFVRTDLCGLIEETTREFGVEPGLLEIEITESDVMREPERAVPVLRTLNAMGVRIAIDDFGTGYSSLAYLAKLPIQALKIDRSFIAAMQEQANELTLVSTMISLAHSLKLKVVAEGVETEEQAKLLALLRCDLLQGFLRGRPMPAVDCTALLKPAQKERKPAPEGRAAA